MFRCKAESVKGLQRDFAACNGAIDIFAIYSLTLQSRWAQVTEYPKRQLVMECA
jgi:hypothetical protein